MQQIRITSLEKQWRCGWSDSEGSSWLWESCQKIFLLLENCRSKMQNLWLKLPFWEI